MVYVKQVKIFNNDIYVCGDNMFKEGGKIYIGINDTGKVYGLSKTGQDLEAISGND